MVYIMVYYGMLWYSCNQPYDDVVMPKMGRITKIAMVAVPLAAGGAGKHDHGGTGERYNDGDGDDDDSLIR